MLDIFYKLFLINPVLAQDDFGTNSLAEEGINLGTRDLAATITGIINIALGFLGILGVILILYGGFVWLTSQGNAEKIQRAKMIIIGAIIGLLIVLSAYAIARFVINNLSDVTGGNNTNTPTNDDPYIPGDDCPQPIGNEVVICDITPNTGPVGRTVHIVGYNFGNITGDVEFQDNSGNISIAEIVTCVDNDEWSNNNITINVPDVAVGNYIVNVVRDDNVRSNVSESNFGVTNDPLGVNIVCLNPSNGPAGTTAVDIIGQGFTDTPGLVHMRGWVGNPGSEQDINIAVDPADWTSTLINIIIPNEALTSYVVVEAGGFTGDEYFRVTCDNDGQCASGCCHNGDWCRPLNYCESGPPAGPYISEIDPPDGAAGNLVTIYGSGFGASAGTVYFYDGVEIIGELPPAICENYWTDTAIVIRVPAAAANGNLQVHLSTAGPDPLTSNTVNFTKNTTLRPGICELDPGTGAFWAQVTAQGVSISTDDSVLFGLVPGYEISYINENSISARVPNLLPDTVRTQVQTSGGILSNSLPFTVLPTGSGDPFIADVISGLNDPHTGPVGQYLTVIGTNFGNSQGRITFNGIDGNFDFPDQCQNNVWQNNQIIVKVPDGVTIPSNPPIIVEKNGGGASNTYTDFRVIAGSPSPGLCLLQPNNGPVGMSVDLYGEGFGNADGDVIFYDGQNASYSSWTDGQILNAEVPVGAITGPVRVMRDDGPPPSNSINFAVGACPNDAYCADNGLGSICCPDPAGAYCTNSCDATEVNQCVYSWTITSESNLYMVYHDPECDDACGNAIVSADFNTQIQGDAAGNLDPDWFAIHACNDPDCNTFNPANLTTSVTQEEMGELWHVEMDHDPFTVDGYYQVVIDPTIQNTDGAILGSDPLPTWIFSVGTAYCEIESISIEPTEGYVEVGNDISYLAFAHPGDDTCGGSPISCEAPDCVWDGWTSGDEAIATVSPNAGLPNTLATGVSVNDTTAHTSINSGSFDDQAIIHVVEDDGQDNFTIIYHYPDCDGVCTNVTPAFRASSAIAGDNDWENIFSITDDTGEEYYTDYFTQLGYVWLEHNPFSPGQRYTVTISGDLRSASGEELGENFVWDFTTGAEECNVDDVQVFPETYDSVTSDEAVRYAAFAYSEDNSCGGGNVLCEDCEYTWSSDVMSVATVTEDAEDNMFADAQVVLQEGAGSTEIRVEVTEPGNLGNPFRDSGTLNVSLGFHPRILTLLTEPEYPPDLSCLNTSAVVVFDQLMDISSVRENAKVYELVPGTPPGCIPYSSSGSSYCPLPASYRFVRGDWEPSDPEEETKVIINTTEYLEADSSYAILVSPEARGENGLSLNPLDLNWPFPATHYRHAFETADNAQVCQINFMAIEPDQDLFTCATDDCVEDDNTGAGGNQHFYTALAYDIRGTLLNVNSAHTWHSNDETILSIDEADTDDQIEGTAQNKNGQTVLSVTVDDPLLGHGSATAGIEIFLCENPWPNFYNFPWEENSYNFSTYYCIESGISGDPILPALDFPPMSNPNISDPTLIEYIFTIDYSLALKNTPNNIFGSLAVTEDRRSAVQDSWFDKLISFFRASPAQGQSGPTDLPGIDIIGLRVMKNDEHLTVFDWYKKYAPNPNENGAQLEVDGYQALQVGNTTYMAATNLSDGSLYTNIYIIASNIGARAATIEIVSQMLDNWTYNINIDQQDNVCSDPENMDIACSSDFDCPGADVCESRGLKLRRDLVRLGDLLNIRNLVEQYGQNHKACSNNNLITCTGSGQCPAGGECVPYYPLLNAGSYVDGLSTSNWPSWQQTLSPTLASVLPEDVIGQFNGCPDGADPNTCWNEDALQFTCPSNSLIYLYNNLSSGADYDLGSNFEYDLNPDPGNGITFADDLNSYVGLENIIMNLGAPYNYCIGTPVNGGIPGSIACGDGIPDYDGVDNIPYNEDDEECDGGFRDNMCDLPPLGEHDWWNEHSAGCYPPGSINADGDLVECTWYDFIPPLTPAQCGGWCGDNIYEPIYESCEVVNGDTYYNGNYNCSGSVPLTCGGDTCQPMCGSVPAAQCGDGVWSSGAEECDASANPDGLDGISCSQDGNAFCDPVSCTIECDSGTPYAGQCGNGDLDYACSVPGYYNQADCLNPPGGGAGGVWEPIEDCDYADWDQPDPDESNPNNPYTCNTDCTFGTNYCGDGDWQNSYGERCDPGTLPGINPEPMPPITTAEASSETNQYECTPACLPLEGGYCGNGDREDMGGPGNPEQCDDGDGDNNDICSNSCDWTCYANASGLPAGNVITYSPVTFGFPPNDLESITLTSDQNTRLNLPHCRVSGNVLVDLNLPPYQPETTGVVFVTDLSGSMQQCIGVTTGKPSDLPFYPPDRNCNTDPACVENPAGAWTLATWGWVSPQYIMDHPCSNYGGSISRIEAVVEAMTETNGALDTIFAENPNVDVALVSFGTDAVRDSDFSDSTAVDALKNTVANYRYTATKWGTDHRDGLCAAYLGSYVEGAGGDQDCTDGVVADTLNWSSYNNKVAVFMTDGAVSVGQSGVGAADWLKDTHNFELFTVLIGNDPILGSYMNFLASLLGGDCDRFGGDGPNGICGDGIVNCRNSQNPNQFEECDGVNCNASCQWINTNSNRSYQATASSDIVDMYTAIAGSIPVVNNRLILNGVEFPIYGEGNITDFVIDIRQLNISSCEEGDSVNSVPMSLHFSAAPGSTATISNGDYRYCPWTD